MLSYKEALDYLGSLINYEKKVDFTYNQRLFNLERTRTILRELGNPHLFLKAIHIAGTKGKGSTAAIAASILDAAGYKVGLYTSPHLISPRERIKIGNILISKEEFSSYLTKVKSAVEGIEYNANPLHPTFFEVYTALAFLYFHQKKVDIAVIEVGLGGRLDATNVIWPLVEVITPISIDHTQQLGTEIISIAKEKAGIIKPQSKVIISSQEEEVLSLLQEICQEKQAKYYLVGKDIKFKLIKATPTYQKFEVAGLLQSYPLLFLPLAGEHQLWNATTAIGVVELLPDFGFRVSREHIKQGLKKVKWVGRIQIISREPITLIDCAHNASSAQVLAKFLRDFYADRKLVLVIAVLKNKDVEGIAKALCPLADKVIATSVNSPRALPTKDLFTKIKRYCHTEPLMEENVKNAIDKARETARKKGIVCITGSVYLVGEALLNLKRGEKNCQC
ncbi:bifunctional folylpolyglutamate synthase/dihydrofolate synthase [Candidatus Aerophobetes bacterium]|nr:bifunctional folylpolyglutamate synthase/dihydrofolate synthase [Candidatus Aerophobetes bacterium]